MCNKRHLTADKFNKIVVAFAIEHFLRCISSICSGSINCQVSRIDIADNRIFVVFLCSVQFLQAGDIIAVSLCLRRIHFRSRCTACQFICDCIEIVNHINLTGITTYQLVNICRPNDVAVLCLIIRNRICQSQLTIIIIVAK